MIPFAGSHLDRKVKSADERAWRGLLSLRDPPALQDGRATRRLAQRELPLSKTAVPG
jgi:hypothetical protein